MASPLPLASTQQPDDDDDDGDIYGDASSHASASPSPGAEPSINRNGANRRRNFNPSTSTSVSSADISISISVAESDGDEHAHEHAHDTEDASPAALRASRDIAALSGTPVRRGQGQMRAGSRHRHGADAGADDPDFAPVNDDFAVAACVQQVQANADANTRVPNETTRLLPDETSASASNADADRLFPTTSLFDTNYNFDPNAVGASAPAGVTGSVHGMSLHQFFFPRYNPTIQRYYRFTTSQDAPFAALHKRPGNGGAGSTSNTGSGGTATNTNVAVNNSGVTGLLRRSAGEYYDTMHITIIFSCKKAAPAYVFPRSRGLNTCMRICLIHSFILSFVHLLTTIALSLSSQSYPLMEPMSQANGFWSASAGEAGGRGRSSSARSTHGAPDRPSRPRLLCRHTPPPCLWDRPCRPVRQQHHNKDRSNQRRPSGRRKVGWAIITSYARER